MALKSSFDYHPKANSPILYSPGVDPILQLDPNTFEDTIFDPENQNAFIVEFYADWCGYCRNFMPTYKEFARQVQRWGSVVKVAAINCADSFNTEVCCANGIQTIPTMKYFPRNTRNYTDGIKLTADSHSLVGDLKEELLGYVINDYNQNKYEDWPKFQYMEENGQANDLWTDIDSANFSVIVFEQNDTDATQLMMDLYPYKNQVDVKRAQDSSPLLKNLEINEYPYAVMYKKGEDKPVFMAP
uniref:Thioredoxin domain-containing protein n=1 Tax=Acrobeloides nanus TaxID=290746 RepID=A0A914DCB5_9BILA